MSERRDTVFPVPEGISRTQWPYTHDVSTDIINDECPTDRCIQSSFEVAHIRILLCDALSGMRHKIRLGLESYQDRCGHKGK